MSVRDELVAAGLIRPAAVPGEAVTLERVDRPCLRLDGHAVREARRAMERPDDDTAGERWRNRRRGRQDR